MIKIGIVGATGYTACQLIKILLRHPHIEIVRATSRNTDRIPIDHFHPSLKSRCDVVVQPYELDDFLESGVQCAFTCLPHAASAKIVKQLLENGIKVVDFSADYRLNDWQTFESWYHETHPDRERVGKVPYGLPELFRKEIVAQQLVANPGCFPTSAILPIAPLIGAGLVESDNIIIDSKSGVTGAGRSPKPHLHFPQCNESIQAYAIGTHRHGPEIQQIVHRSTGIDPGIVFTPHLVPMDRGILSTIYLNPTKGTKIEAIRKELIDRYSNEPFVRMRNELPTTKDVVDTNYCDIAVERNQNLIVIVSAIDNLVKGASGAAVQNFNLMYELTETTGLL